MAMRNTLTVLGAKHAKPGRYCDGQGLWLRKRKPDSGSWILRMTVFGRRRGMGLGPWPDVTISEARDRASEARRTLRYGTDPIEQRREKREQHNKLL